MQDLRENAKLFKYLMAMFAVAACGIFDIFDFVREYLQLVPFPNLEFQITVIAALIVDFAICYVVESIIKKRYLATFK